MGLFSRIVNWAKNGYAVISRFNPYFENLNFDLDCIKLINEEINQGYIKCKETNDARYIPWNFEDVKKKIDAISTDSIFYDHKKLLQDLTAGVISLRDTYEIYAWWSNENPK